MAEETTAWKKGDAFWRGYARSWDSGQTYYPEIRAGHIQDVNDDGTYRCIMVGIMPGMERKRTPGGWIAFGLDPDLMHQTPEAALACALTAVEQASETSKGEAA
ncbi:hypothetical protein [Hyphomicrobium sp. MC1]|uniref:hypothetical protein n=1 Tax=Hyphomicrobium sp. (strain MC1) TaxID=717785 RepID=UPI000213DA85|nr:hypothetical protein [Hyphomicrobium sp. MC1]CCB64426.1 protein of unknown function [Hyphomicrobium sp. MC1]